MKSHLFIVLAASSILTACGGGGGGGSSTTSGSVLSGTASKGLLKNALVTAYCGIKPSNPVGTTSTDDDGNYSLTLTSACSQPIEIVVTAKASGTTILDEITGSPVPAPANLSMRAFVPSSGTTITQQVTPFTDMAAALVENAVTNNKQALSAGMVSNANTAIVTNVLGGNAGLFNAAPLPPTAYNDATTTADQKQLITLLSGIAASASQLTTGTAGEKIQTILTQLSAQATQTIPTVTTTTYGVSGAANTSATSGANATPLATITAGLTAITNSTVTVNGAPAALTTTATTLQTSIVAAANTQINSNRGTTTTPPSSATQSAIAAVQQLLSKLRTNLLTTGQSFLQGKADAMKTDFNTVALTPVYAIPGTAAALLETTKFLLDVNTAIRTATTPPNTWQISNNLSGNGYGRSWYASGAPTPSMECRVFTTAGTGLPSATPARTTALTNNSQPPVAVCAYWPFNGDLLKQMHFIVKQSTSSPTSGATFTYINRVRTWASSSCMNYFDASCSVTDSLIKTGTFTATWDSNGISGVAFNGPVVPFDGLESSGTDTTMTLNLSRSLNGTPTPTSGSFNMSAGLTNGNVSLALTQGTLSADATAGTASFNLTGRVQTGAFRYDGSFTGNVGNGNTATPNGTIGFNGAISTMSGSTATPFLEGSISANSAAKTIAFSGKVTNGTNVNNLSGTVDNSTAGQSVLSLTYAFPGYSITSSGTNYDNTALASTITSTASDGTKMVATRTGGIHAVVFKDSANNQIGTIANGQVNFTDGSYLVLN